MDTSGAIEILEDLMTSLPQFPPEMRRKAVMLGIEALRESEWTHKIGVLLYRELLERTNKEKEGERRDARLPLTGVRRRRPFFT